MMGAQPAVSTVGFGLSIFGSNIFGAPKRVNEGYLRRVKSVRAGAQVMARTGRGFHVFFCFFFRIQRSAYHACITNVMRPAFSYRNAYYFCRT